MKKKIKFVSIIIFIILIFVIGISLGFILFTIGFSNLSGDDDLDSIANNIEFINKRDTNLTFNDDFIIFNSVGVKNSYQNNIIYNIDYNDACISVSYTNYQILDNKENIVDAIFFNLTFVKIIEYNDENGDDIYSNESDHLIKTLLIHNLTLLEYEFIGNGDNGNNHHFKIGMKNETFIVNFYFSNEYIKVDERIVPPTQIHIISEINNFTLDSENSSLGLVTEIKSENQIVENEYTENEKYQFITREESLNIKGNKDDSGYFSWRELVRINETEREVNVKSVITNYCSKMYFNYQNLKNDSIFHDFSIGFEGIILMTQSNNTITLIIVSIVIYILIIGISVIFAINYHNNLDKYYTSSKNPSTFNIVNQLNDKRKVKSILKKQSDLTPHRKDLLITAISEEFFELIDLFKWKREDKKLFIKEMLALSPQERKKIFRALRGY